MFFLKKSSNIRPFFSYSEKECPGAFLFKIDKPETALILLKQKLQEKGIECSVFYGKPAFFVPCHQYIAEPDALYFHDSIKNFFLREIEI